MKYTALISNGASLSLVNSVVKDFPINKLNKPLTVSTITNKGIVHYEILSMSPKEFNLKKEARVK